MSNEVSSNTSLRTTTTYFWTEAKKRAARLLADGSFTKDEICARTPCSPLSLWRWKKQPRFTARVAKLQEILAVKEAEQILALRVRRLKELGTMDAKLNQVIEERAADPKMQNVPGGKTGLLTVDYKTVAGEKVPIYSVDTALLREKRETEKQAAIEAGQWLEKREISGAAPQITVVEIVRPVMPGDAPSVDQVIEQTMPSLPSQVAQDDGWDDEPAIPEATSLELAQAESAPAVLYDPDD